VNAVGWLTECELNSSHACDKRKPFALISTNSSIPADNTARPLRRRRMVIYCVIVWTAFVGLALWWLMYGHNGPSVWIAKEPGSAHASTQTFHAWFSTDMSSQRFYPWILFGPYIALVSWYFPLERGRLRLNLPLNLAVCLVFVVICQAMNARTRLTFGNVTIARSSTDHLVWPTKAIQNLSSPGSTNRIAHMPPNLKSFPPPELPDLSLWSALLDLLAYGAIVGLAHSVHFYQRFREREKRALLLESNLANARLDALRAQLQPHFLFNSLNAIAALLRRDPRLAETTLVSLSELLRLALGQSEKPEISLRDEMKFVQRYLEIQQTRFGDKLRIEQEIEPAALDCLVPTLLLQPLIENAIKHGIEPSENAGLVRLTGQCRDGKLVLTVEDNGVGFAGRDTANGGTGIGLTNLRARLETLYGVAQKLELIPCSEGGLIVRVEIPWHPTTASETSGASNPL
jgi:two-component system, LytTR family, sensor kinase